MDDTAVTQGLMQITEPSCDGTFKIPNFDYVHAELAKPHVTLKLLWEEYVEQCRQSNERFYILHSRIIIPMNLERRWYCLI